MLRPSWRLSAIGILGFLALTTRASTARADWAAGALDYPYAKRQLCYSISEKVMADPSWPAWTDAAFANWQAVSNQTGWQFRKCAAGEAADIVILFADESKPDDTAAGSFNGGTWEIKIVPDVVGRRPNDDGPRIAGGKKGWDTSGPKTVDPVRVIMHEITHAMRLVHGAGWDGPNFEEPISPGQHTGTKPSANDITETHKAALADKPPPNITVQLPPCADDDAKTKLKGELDAIKTQLEAQLEEIDTTLFPKAQNGESNGEYKLYREQFFAKLHADPDAERAASTRGKQVISNLEHVRDLLAALAGLSACGHASSSPGGASDNANLRGLQLGLRAGYAIAFGKEDGGDDTAGTGGAPGTDLSEVSSGQIPIWVDAGWRFSPNLYVGVYFQYGIVLRNRDTSGCAQSGASCTANDIVVGVNAHYHFLPGAKLDPWVGLGVGYEWLTTSTSIAGTSFDGGASGLQLANIQGGADYAIAPRAGIKVGPFLSFSLGRYTSSIGSGSSDIASPAFHEWLTIGVRGTYDLAL